MKKAGKLIFGLVLTGFCVLNARAEPVPEPAKVPLSDEDEEPVSAELRQAQDAVVAIDDSSPSKDDSSSGRLFMKKFLLFKNFFGNNQQQPIIPIIITGGANTAPTAPTDPTAITTSGTVPSATATITTSPVTGRIQPEEGTDEDGAEGTNAGVDVQALQAALAVGAQEYVVTDQEIKGTSPSDSKATKQENLNLRRKGNRKSQVIRLRIPAQYRRYFKNGQKVVLNTGNRQANRRVTKRKVVNRRRVNKNRNNRNRLVSII